MNILFEEEKVWRVRDVSMGRYAERMPNVIRGCSSVQYLLERRDAKGGVRCRRRRCWMKGGTGAGEGREPARQPEHVTLLVKSETKAIRNSCLLLVF
jgi:hypothetical protein